MHVTGIHLTVRSVFYATGSDDQVQRRAEERYGATTIHYFLGLALVDGFQLRGVRLHVLRRFFHVFKVYLRVLRFFGVFSFLYSRFEVCFRCIDAWERRCARLY